MKKLLCLIGLLCIASVHGTVIDFEEDDWVDGQSVGNYRGLTFSDDWKIWDDYSNAYYPQASGTDAIYSFNYGGSIDFNRDVDITNVWLASYNIEQYIYFEGYDAHNNLLYTSLPYNGGFVDYYPLGWSGIRVLKVVSTAANHFILDDINFEYSDAGLPGDYSPDSLLVFYNPDISAAQRRTTRLAVNATIQDSNGDEEDDRYLHLLDRRLARYTLNGMSVQEAIDVLSADPAVQFVEPDYRVAVDFVPNDPYFPEQWALNNTGQENGLPDADMDAPEAWEATTGSKNVVVGILDSGIDYTHPDLDDNMWRNPGEIAGNHLDDDQNGYIDDVYGIDTYDDDSDPADDLGHGTHIAGIIGAEGNNGLGVTGINQEVALAGCKFIGAKGTGLTSKAIECLDYFLGLKLAGNNIRVLNLSWGTNDYSIALDFVLHQIFLAEISVAASAGNSGQNIDEIPYYPASHMNSVAVTGVNRWDGDAGYSYGPTSVDLAAPATAILSTIPHGGYASYSGTSMAAAQVSGAMALIVAAMQDAGQEPSYVPGSVLPATGDPLAVLTDKTWSGRRLNISNALDALDLLPTFSIEQISTATRFTVGQTVEIEMAIESGNGFEGPVALTLDAPLPGAYLSTNEEYAGNHFSVFLPTDPFTVPGHYSITVTGQAGSQTATKVLDIELLPANQSFKVYRNQTPIRIPDYRYDTGALAVESTIRIADVQTIADSEITLDIQHGWSWDLIVKLRSPSGTELVLHDQGPYSGTYGIDKTYLSDVFNNESVKGDWVLSITDNQRGHQGELISWSLGFVLQDLPDSTPPAASFDYQMQKLAVRFVDTSTAGNARITRWYWRFGDGTSSHQQNVVHRYSKPGSYQVVLIVTDAAGNKDRYTTRILVGRPLTASLVRAHLSPKGVLRAELTWSGANGQKVLIVRNGHRFAVNNSGEFTDVVRNVRPGTRFTYQVCDTSGACSEAIHLIP